MPGRDLTFSVGDAESTTVPVFSLGPAPTRAAISEATLARWPRLREALEKRLGEEPVDDVMARGARTASALVDFLESVGLTLSGGDARPKEAVARKSAPSGHEGDTKPREVLDLYGSDQVLDEALLLDGIGRAYVGGVTIDWALIFPERRPLISLPPYAFQRRSMLQRRWRPSAADGDSARPSATAYGVALRPVELTSQKLDDGSIEERGLDGHGRILAPPTDLGGAVNLLSMLLAEPVPQPVVLTLPASGTAGRQLISAFLIAITRVLRLERPNLRLACVGDTQPDPVGWSSSSIARVWARTPVWWGPLDRGRIETLGAELAAQSVSHDHLDRSTMIVGGGATAEDLVESLRGRGYDAVRRDWATMTAPTADVARLFAILPRADRREVVTSSNLGLLANTYQAQAARLDALFSGLSGPIDLRLVRGLEGSFGWPGRVVDVALGEYAWSKALDLEARGVRASCIDWPVLRTGAEDQDELERTTAHGLSAPPVEALVETLLRPLPSAGRFVAHSTRDAMVIETGVSVGVLAARFRPFEPPGSKPKDGQDGFLRIVAEALGLRNADPDPALSLLDLGADSLMGLEIAKRAQAELGLDIDIQDLLSDSPIGELADRFDGPAPGAVRSIRRDGHVMLDGV
jgi:acyl carrier protein